MIMSGMQIFGHKAYEPGSGPLSIFRSEPGVAASQNEQEVGPLLPFIISVRKPCQKTIVMVDSEPALLVLVIPDLAQAPS